MKHASLLLVVALATACGGGVSDPTPAPTGTTPAPPGSSAPPSTPAQPPPAGALSGDYGHEGESGRDVAASLAAQGTGASYRFNCFSGQSSTIVPRADGTFSVTGSLTSLGGPVETIDDVTFSGTVSGDTIVFTASWASTITTQNGTQPYTETFGPYTVVKGVTPTQWTPCI